MRSVSVTREDRIATVTFSRQEPQNTLCHDTMRDLTAVARSFADDARLNAVILRGKPENFCLGFDLKDPELREISSLSLPERRLRMQTGARMCKAWEDIEALTISAIEGWCVGGGVALAVATDLRVLSETARIYVPEIERGLNMSWGSIPRITNLVGPARAKRLIVLAEKLTAQQAESWGLADELAEPERSYDAARSLAERAASLPPTALRMCKQGINAYANALAHLSTYSDFDQFALAFENEEAAEGIGDFLTRGSET